jgi:hypothetical protein
MSKFFTGNGCSIELLTVICPVITFGMDFRTPRIYLVQMKRLVPKFPRDGAIDEPSRNGVIVFDALSSVKN